MKKIKIPVIILCGGYGTRFGSETKKIPKALINIAGKPIIHHLIEYFLRQTSGKIYLACGYKFSKIKNYIKNKNLSNKVEAINTGLNSMTGGRLLNLKKKLNSFDRFIVTYGDGLANIKLKKLLKSHFKNKGICTITAVRPFLNFGELNIKKNNRVDQIHEKELIDNRWINGGFIVFEKKVFDYIKSQKDVLEKNTFKEISKIKKLYAYKHFGFWKCLDNYKDKIEFNSIVKKNKKIWLR